MLLIMETFRVYLSIILSLDADYGMKTLSFQNKKRQEDGLLLWVKFCFKNLQYLKPFCSVKKKKRHASIKSGKVRVKKVHVKNSKTILNYPRKLYFTSENIQKPFLLNLIDLF